MTAPAFPPLGAIVSFECDRASLEIGMPSPYDWTHPMDKRVAACGKVVAVAPMQPHGPGKIPTAAVTIEGRTGKRVTIDGAGCRLKVWPGWTEAVAHVQSFNRSTPPGLSAGGKAAR